MSLRILTYNISWEGQLGAPGGYADGRACIDSVTSTNACPANVLRLIRASNADIVLLQEASIDERDLRRMYKIAEHTSGKERMLTLYRDQVTGPLLTTIPGEFSTGYPFLITVFQHFVVVNLHRSHGNPQTDTRTLETAMAPVALYLQRRSLIVGGDFNIEMNSNMFIAEKQLDIGVAEQPLKTCCTPTFGVADRNYTVRYDYIGIDERLRFDILRVPISPEENVRFSDHLPVFAVVSVRGSYGEDASAGIRYRLFQPDTLLYRGTNKTMPCDTIDESVRSGRPEWYAQYRAVTRPYSEGGGCVLQFKTIKTLRLIDLWDPVTLNTVVKTYTEWYADKRITQEEYDAFRVTTGYGIDKHDLNTSVVALFVHYGWGGNTSKASSVDLRGVGQIMFPGLSRISSGAVEWRGVVWGPGPTHFNRTSTYQGDWIVMDTLYRMFPGYDGVYARPVPSTFHGGVFHEEFILFKEVPEKVVEVSRTPAQ